MPEKRERIPIRPGDQIRCPDRGTARWRKVVRVSRRRDGTRFITIRRSRFWRAFGLPAVQRIEWAHIRAVGYGLKRAQLPGKISDPNVHDWPNPPAPPEPVAATSGPPDFSEGPEDKPNFDSVIDTLKRDER